MWFKILVDGTETDIVQGITAEDAILKYMQANTEYSFEGIHVTAILYG